MATESRKAGEGIRTLDVQLGRDPGRLAFQPRKQAISLQSIEFSTTFKSSHGVARSHALSPYSRATSGNQSGRAFDSIKHKPSTAWTERRCSQPRTSTPSTERSGRRSAPSHVPETRFFGPRTRFAWSSRVPVRSGSRPGQDAFRPFRLRFPISRRRPTRSPASATLPSPRSPAVEMRSLLKWNPNSTSSHHPGSMIRNPAPGLFPFSPRSRGNSVIRSPA